MPAKKTTDGAAPTGLSENELRFIKAVFDNMTQKPDANWNQVAGDLGLKDAKCAKERFRQMSVRHGWREQGGASPRKTKADGAAADSKVTKKPRTPRKKAKKEECSDDEEPKQEDEEDAVKSEESVEE